MYICICNGHRDTDIAAAAANGQRCVRQIYAQLGGEPQCGQCLDMAADVVSSAAGEGAALSADDGRPD